MSPVSQFLTGSFFSSDYDVLEPEFFLSQNGVCVKVCPMGSYGSLPRSDGSTVIIIILTILTIILILTILTKIILIRLGGENVGLCRPCHPNCSQVITAAHTQDDSDEITDFVIIMIIMIIIIIIPHPHRADPQKGKAPDRANARIAF